MGGALASEPSPVNTSSGVLDVFWRGTDSALWHKWFTGGVWGGPQSLGDGPLPGPPHAVGQPSGVIDVFWQGTDNGLWHAWFSGAWAGPQRF
jgi:hypothetical protein